MPVYEVSGFEVGGWKARVETRSAYDAKRLLKDHLKSADPDLVPIPIGEWHTECVHEGLQMISPFTTVLDDDDSI